MGFFDDDNDPFEDIIREFFGSSSSRRKSNFSDDEFTSGEDEERNIDFIEGKNKFFVVFELPGYDEKDISIKLKGDKLIVDAKKDNTENLERYMADRLLSGVKITKTLPDFIKKKNYDYTFKNGILEVSFKK